MAHQLAMGTKARTPLTTTREVVHIKGWTQEKKKFVDLEISIGKIAKHLLKLMARACRYAGSQGGECRRPVGRRAKKWVPKVWISKIQSWKIQDGRSKSGRSKMEDPRWKKLWISKIPNGGLKIQGGKRLWISKVQDGRWKVQGGIPRFGFPKVEFEEKK